MFLSGFQEYIKGVPRKFYNASKKFHGCSKEDIRGFQWSFKWVSRVFKRISIGICGKFQRCFKDVSSKFYACFKGLRSVLRDLKVRFRGASRVSKRSPKVVSREF